jgi:hypothetical protein
VVLALTIIFNFMSIRPALHHLLDFGSFIAAGKEAAVGKNPYTADSPLVYRVESDDTDQSVPSPNLNPPLSILFFIPLSKLDPARAVSGWRIATAILFGAGIFTLAGFYPTSLNPVRILWALSLTGFWQILALGQIYAPLLLLAIGTYILTARGYPKLAGFALGVLVAIKPNFVFWVLLLGAAGHLTTAITAVIVICALSILPILIFGLELYRQWLIALSNYPSIGLLIAGNTSFQSLTARFGSALTGTIISVLFVVLFVGGSLYFAYFRKLPVNKLNALGILGSLLISPFSWVGYTILTLPIFFSRSRWSWQYKLSAALLSFPYVLILFFFQKSLLHSVLFGWLYGWGLVLIVADLILNKEDNSLEQVVENQI